MQKVKRLNNHSFLHCLQMQRPLLQFSIRDHGWQWIFVRPQSLKAFWPGHLLSQFGFGAVVKQLDLLFVSIRICLFSIGPGPREHDTELSFTWRQSSMAQWVWEILRADMTCRTCYTEFSDTDHYLYIFVLCNGSIYGEVYTPAICFTGRRNGTGVSVLLRMAWSTVSRPPLSMAHLWCWMWVESLRRNMVTIPWSGLRTGHHNGDKFRERSQILAWIALLVGKRMFGVWYNSNCCNSFSSNCESGAIYNYPFNVGDAWRKLRCRSERAPNVVSSVFTWFSFVHVDASWFVCLHGWEMSSRKLSWNSMPRNNRKLPRGGEASFRLNLGISGKLHFSRPCFATTAWARQQQTTDHQADRWDALLTTMGISSWIALVFYLNMLPGSHW